MCYNIHTKRFSIAFGREAGSGRDLAMSSLFNFLIPPSPSPPKNTLPKKYSTHHLDAPTTRNKPTECQGRAPVRRRRHRATPSITIATTGPSPTRKRASSPTLRRKRKSSETIKRMLPASMGGRWLPQPCTPYALHHYVIAHNLWHLNFAT